MNEWEREKKKEEKTQAEKVKKKMLCVFFLDVRKFFTLPSYGHFVYFAYYILFSVPKHRNESKRREREKEKCEREK